MKGPFCLLVYDGYDLSAFKGPFLIYGKICGKAGKRGFPDQFLKRKRICLYQEPGGGLSPSEIFHVSTNLEKKPTGTSVTFENKKYRWDDYSHNNIVENVIPMEK